eukprot:TRINITY_DN19699_c0_g1_i1.p1 TRINITY_DN19699_c0_g1~~TRINITY_DN19699_c0_g1_i1.p1  ORF type:complete len:151 (-),score=32.38 TRINITY_DN19699_c0_g1_i1:15-437(-)
MNHTQEDKGIQEIKWATDSFCCTKCGAEYAFLDDFNVFVPEEKFDELTPKLEAILKFYTKKAENIGKEIGAQYVKEQGDAFTFEKLEEYSKEHEQEWAAKINEEMKLKGKELLVNAGSYTFEQKFHSCLQCNANFQFTDK